MGEALNKILNGELNYADEKINSIVKQIFIGTSKMNLKAIENYRNNKSRLN